MRLSHLLLDVVFPPHEAELLVRSLSFDQLSLRLSPVLRGEGTHAVMSLFPYDDEFAQTCILEAKFGANERAAELLGSALHEFLYEFLGERAGFDSLPPVIVPLPLFERRLKERGYNQTERIVRAVCANGLRVEIDTNILIRTRETAQQTSLSGTARRSNVSGAFVVTSTCDPYRTYIVVDDVITTGHTMRAACEALRAGGAKRLLPLTLAY